MIVNLTAIIFLARACICTDADTRTFTVHGLSGETFTLQIPSTSNLHDQIRTALNFDSLLECRLMRGTTEIHNVEQIHDGDSITVIYLPPPPSPDLFYELDFYRERPIPDLFYELDFYRERENRCRCGDLFCQGVLLHDPEVDVGVADFYPLPAFDDRLNPVGEFAEAAPDEAHNHEFICHIVKVMNGKDEKEKKNLE